MSHDEPTIILVRGPRPTGHTHWLPNPQGTHAACGADPDPTNGWPNRTTVNAARVHPHRDITCGTCQREYITAHHFTEHKTAV